MKLVPQKEIIQRLQKKMPGVCILEKEPMRNHTSFKIGGPADLFFIPQNKEEIAYAIELCKKYDFPFYIMGNGSNLLVSDQGYRGMIIQVYKNMSDVKIEGERVWAEAGILLSTLSKKIVAAHLAGFEFASGIPGTLGGGLYMNAGAYDGEIKFIVESVEVIDTMGQYIILRNKDMKFEYRNSILQRTPYIVTAASLHLKKGNKEDIITKIRDFTERRKTKQPLEYPSAGSTFKRPKGFYAGKLIMDSGLRGYQIGGAQVSEKHCGFIINKGNATAEDVKTLIQFIQKQVKEKFDVLLEPEVRFLGE
ncbi:MAG: UDP-N-acetylmuramate dehydrogenase [Epulopiscium sp.]|nr:UDP-N-acetylmuramate dehydrogenase [Candidatus Epulonipiscium sp.]